jgi:nucleoside-diphosphate-sugar epimerase
MTMSSSGSTQVTVVGGTGFVGSRVCQQLVAKGASVKSVSKTGTVPKWCSGEPWTKDVTWVAADLTGNNDNAEDALLDAAVGTPDAIVSCVGVVGTDAEKLVQGNGATNVAAFASAKRGGKLTRSVLVSVSSEVAACKDNWLPDFFGGYFEGKQMAEDAAMDAVQNDAAKVCIVKPTFIYGGDAFGLLPPRVNYAYGSAVEELLSLGLFQALADATPGLIKVALRPPSSVDAVAAACASAALGEIDGGILDGTPAINSATDHPAATGLTEALEWAKENAIKAYDWAKLEVPKAIESSKAKIEDLQNK